MKPPYKEVVEKLEILTRLAEFAPVVIGTPPLGIATDKSDIDIACTSLDFDRFFTVVSLEFDCMEGFSTCNVYDLSAPAAVASFKAMGWEVELFCQKISTKYQWGFRHFSVEARLLELEPHLKDAVMRLKREGLKTEPAFARLLSLPGDPYIALLELESLDDANLQKVIKVLILEGCI